MVHDRGQFTTHRHIAPLLIAFAVLVVVSDAVIRRVPSDATFTEVCGGGCGASPFGLLTVVLLVSAYAVLIMSHVKRDPPAKEGDE